MKMSFRHAFHDHQSEQPGSEKERETMKNEQPLFESATHYRIEVRGCIDLEWLQSFDLPAEIAIGEAGQLENITVLDVRTDQSGIVGLVRRLHGLGMTILQFQIIQ